MDPFHVASPESFAPLLIAGVLWLCNVLYILVNELKDICKVTDIFTPYTAYEWRVL